MVAVEAPSPERSKAYAGAPRRRRSSGRGSRRRGSPTGSIRRTSRAAACSTSPVDELDQAARSALRLPGVHRGLRGPADAAAAPRGAEPADRQRDGARLLRPRAAAAGGATDLRFLESVIDQISARLDGETAYTSPWAAAFSLGRLDDPDAGYFFSADRQLAVPVRAAAPGGGQLRGEPRHDRGPPPRPSRRSGPSFRTSRRA